VRIKGTSCAALAVFVAMVGAPEMARAAGASFASTGWGYGLAAAAAAVGLLAWWRGARGRAWLDSSPVGLVWWSGHRSGMTGPARALLGSNARIDDIAGIFEAYDSALLTDLLAALRDRGAPFEGCFQTKTGPVLRLNGCRTGGCDMLWITASDGLSEKDKALRDVLDLLPNPVWWRDGALQLIGGNTAYAQALDSDITTVIAQGRELGADQRDGRALARRAAQTQNAQSESRHIVVVGRRRLYEFTETRLAGEAPSVAGYATDVTLIEEVQSELAAHVAAHGDVLEMLGAAICIFGPDRRLTFFNTAFLELWRIDAAALNGEPALDDMLEMLRERRRLPEYIDFLAFKQESGALFHTLIEPREELLHLPDERTLRLVISPHPMGGLLFVYEDVTDNLALERSYNTLIAVQRTTLNKLHEAVAVFGADGRLRLWNAVMAEMWGFADDDSVLDIHIGVWVERTKALFGPVDDWDAHKQKLILSVTEPEAGSGRLRLLDGRIIDFNRVPLPDGGCLLGYLDVTDGARMQRALEERNLALENADRLKSDFIANVSYELRTPLNAIIGFTEILDRRYFGELNQRQKEYIEGTLQASNHLMVLINDIIDLATIEAGYFELEIGTLDVRNALSNLLNAFRNRAADSNLTLKFDCPKDIGTIVADEKRLRQAIYNLITNAVQNTPEGGTVTLSARREDDYLSIVVTDGGTGIAPEDADRLFEKFERGSRGQRASGAGLGLALVKNLIALHGGVILVDGGPGKGTRIECRVPLEVAPLRDDASPESQR
jgi:signal transduction histidine kinase